MNLARIYAEASGRGDCARAARIKAEAEASGPPRPYVDLLSAIAASEVEAAVRAGVEAASGFGGLPMREAALRLPPQAEGACLARILMLGTDGSAALLAAALRAVQTAAAGVEAAARAGDRAAWREAMAAALRATAGAELTNSLISRALD